ncbi:IFNL3 protein, partial [Penelope pileata]|nr:IFNL3 protein [Penelope pileata]
YGFTIIMVGALGPLLVGAFPQGTLKKHTGTCSLSKYQSPVPSELEAVRMMKKQYELLTDRRCNIKLFHRKWKTAKLSVPDRVILAEAELDLAITVLTNSTTQGLAEMSEQPLAFFTQAREDLRHCMAVEAPSHQPSGKLKHWLQKLETAKKEETASCLEDAAIIYIFEVLKDLRCAAQREDC